MFSDKAHIEVIQKFKQKFYPELSLTQEELETLSWCINNPIVTPSGEISVDVHFEVKRTFNRLSNIELLRADDYQTFAKNQTEPKMTLEEFKFFSEKFKVMDQSTYHGLCGITSRNAQH